MMPERVHARAETSRWHKAYRDERLVGRRTSSHKRKLSRLGVLDLPREARVLDVACGTGEALTILHEEGFTNLAGSDITADPSLKAKPWLSVDEADACTLPYESDSFDAVLSMHSLHHLGGAVRLGRALDEWMRVLRIGGRLMIVDHYDSLQVRAAFWALGKHWVTWPTRGLRSFRDQLEEEHSYLYDYLDSWFVVPTLLQGLPCEIERDRRGLFFFYWVGRKVRSRAAGG
jgi:SAM-dependent methyltransferase